MKGFFCLRSWRSFLLVGMILLGLHTSASAQLAPECDADGDGTVDGFVSDGYSEGQQQMNLLNFYGASMAYSPIHAPAPLKAFKVVPALELSYIPQLNCLERTVYYGTKTENTNKSPVLPRLRVLVGSPFGAYAGLSFIPPVKIFGVTTLAIGAELGYGMVLYEKLELGARFHGLYTHVVGDLAGPVDESDPFVDDDYYAKVYGGDLSAGYRFAAGSATVVPYLGLGYTRIDASSTIGEDNVTLPGDIAEYQALLYHGLSSQLGAQVNAGKLQGGLEVYILPFGMQSDPAFRTFISPRLTVGYVF